MVGFNLDKGRLSRCQGRSANRMFPMFASCYFRHTGQREDWREQGKISKMVCSEAPGQGKPQGYNAKANFFFVWMLSRGYVKSGFQEC